jgi:excinuclease ABC subunit C
MNARDALIRRRVDDARQAELLEGAARVFGLSGPIERVEVYDNSHIMGTSAVGAMVVAGPEGFMKTHYRTYTISADTIAGDDYGMMREVLRRRFSRLVKDEAEGEDVVRPDLLLIDGGAGQLAEYLAMSRAATGRHPIFG